MSANSPEIFWGQLHEDVLIVPNEKFLEAATQAMGREVFGQELNDRQSLKEEFVERIPAKTLDELSAKIPQQGFPELQSEKQTAS